jgi:hypothetical protein
MFILFWHTNSPSEHLFSGNREMDKDDYKDANKLIVNGQKLRGEVDM